jgi:hypothetical protein
VLNNDLLSSLSLNRLLNLATSRRINKRVLGLLLNEFNKRLERSITIVIDEVASSGGLEFDGWETGDAEGHACWEIVLCGVHLGDGDFVFDVGVSFTEFVPDGFQAFAVSAPAYGIQLAYFR